MIPTMNKQQRFEIESHNRAIKRMEQEVLRAKQKAYFSSTSQARLTIAESAVPLAEDLRKFLSLHSEGRASTTAAAIGCPEINEWTHIVDPSIISVIVLKSVFDLHGVYDKLTPSKAANFIGTRLEDEARFRFYEITAPEEVVKAAWKRVTEAGSSPRYRRLSTKLITEKMLEELQVDEELRWKRWPDHYRITIGLALLEFCYSQGLVKKFTTYVKAKKKTTFIELTPECLAMQEALFDRMKSLSYMSWPLIEPPLSWQVEAGEARDNTSGGYHTQFIREQLPLCRGRYYKSEFGSKSVQFLNMLGQTRWKLNAQVVDVARRCLDKGLSLGTLKALLRDPRLDQTMPTHLQGLPTDHDDRKAWRRQMKALHEEHEAQRRKSIRSRQAISMAEEFTRHDHFYLGWSNDYRGRCYSQQPWLNPQTTDMEKSMLTFADGLPLTERGELWAAQAVGAAFLGSTLAFKDRTTWALQNKEMLAAVASDPISTMGLWEKAKDPWQFLQLALEWNDVLIERNRYLWNVPIGADATASGLQLLSSMLRDPLGMKYANVLPPEDPYAPPEDSYLQVLSIARQKALQTPETEHLVPFMIHRNIGKVTMVHLYGATHGTIRDRIIKVFVKTGDYKAKRISWQDCDKMAYLVEDAARQVFPRAYDALDWLQKLGRAAVKQGITEFKWFTPSDDLIHLQEFKSMSLNLRTSHLGKVTIPTGKSKELDLDAMKAALAPSFIHSYDAALLKVAFDGWNKPLAVVHDCMKAHPSHIDEAHERIRKAFHTVCSGDPLARLADDLGVSPDTLPRLTQGDGNLDGVYDSPYLFN